MLPRAVVTVIFLLLAVAAAQAQNNPLITVDEDGHGLLLFPGAPPFATTGVLAPDPGPGGLSSALTYDLLGPPSLVSGDLRIFETLNGVLSDVVRFNPRGTGNPGYPASLVFYSDIFDSPDSLADVGFPSAFYTNNLSFVEVNIGGGQTGLLYTPTAGQPGFVEGFGVTYRIVSDADPAAPIPEPASLALLGVGLAGLCFSRRKYA